MDDYQKKLVIRHVDCSPALLAFDDAIFFKQRKWIEEDQQRIVKRHAVLS